MNFIHKTCYLLKNKCPKGTKLTLNDLDTEMNIKVSITNMN